MAQRRERPLLRKITTPWDVVHFVCDRPRDTPGGRSHELETLRQSVLQEGQAGGAVQGLPAGGRGRARGPGVTSEDWRLFRCGSSGPVN